MHVKHSGYKKKKWKGKTLFLTFWSLCLGDILILACFINQKNNLKWWLALLFVSWNFHKQFKYSCCCCCCCYVASVVSDSVWPHRRQPTRLHCPWDSPGKNTGVGCVSFSNAWKWKVKVKLLSPARLLATPWTAAYQAPPSMGFSRQEYWSGVPAPSPISCHYYRSK